jgi:methionine synthase II (cobalamin-independent)
MPTSQDRILTTHVGSLVRPPELSRYIEAIDNGSKSIKLRSIVAWPIRWPT